MNPRKKPKFINPGAKMVKRVKPSWRRPKGRQSKVRLKLKGKPKMPSIGYGAPSELRGKHPSGYEEVLVKNVKDLEKVTPETQAIRIASAVGKKKRKLIIEEARKRKIKVLNPQL